MLLSELYQEHKGSSFTHDGEKYDLNKVLKAVDKDPEEEFDVDELKWVLDYDSPDDKRVRKADLTTPILVTRWEGKLVAIDGLHRLQKAVDEGRKKLPGKMVSKKVLNSAKK